MTQVLGFLLPTCETEMWFLAPGFGLPKPQLLLTFQEQTG